MFEFIFKAVLVFFVAAFLVVAIAVIMLFTVTAGITTWVARQIRERRAA